MSPEFANAPALIIDWLRTQYAALADPLLDDVTVGASVPPTRTDATPLVVVRRSGGIASRPVLDRPRLDFMHWHQTEFKASAIAAITRSLVLYELPGEVLGGHTLYSPTELSGPIPYPDPAGSAIPIVMFTMEIPIRVV